MIADIEELDDDAVSQIYLKSFKYKDTFFPLSLSLPTCRKENSKFTILFQLEGLHRKNRHTVSKACTGSCLKMNEILKTLK